MRLNPDQLAAHLAKGLAPLYVVAGEEELLVQESLDAIRAAARKAGYSEREVLDADRYFNWQQLVDACASMSLFATRRIVQLNLPTGAPGEEGGRVLKELAAQPPQDTLLLIVCGALDARARKSAWYTAIENAGASVYAWPVKSGEMTAWLNARLRRAGVAADAEAVRLLAERTEGNLLAAAQDVEKLKLLFPGETIGAAQLAEAVADSARFEAFDLNDRVLDGDAQSAVRSLERLREEGSAVLEILGALTYSLRLLAKAALALPQTRDAAAACERVGIRSFQSARYIKALQRTQRVEALGWLARAARIDQLVKSGAEAQAWEDLLTLVLAASGAARVHAR